MATITFDTTTALDRTVKIFDGFYNQEQIVNAADFDIVNGYFQSVCETIDIANNFTTLFFRIAQYNQIDVLTLLAAIQGTENNLQMNAFICYYLNGFKSKTTLYGIANIPIANQPAARNVVQ